MKKINAQTENCFEKVVVKVNFSEANLAWIIKPYLILENYILVASILY